jgi:hypothetical protein
MKLIITESQLKTVIKEYYDSDRLYPKDMIVNRLKKAPKYMRHYINGLKDIPCTDPNGNVAICVKIPEVVYQFLFGNF